MTSCVQVIFSIDLQFTIVILWKIKDFNQIKRMVYTALVCKEKIFM